MDVLEREAIKNAEVVGRHMMDRMADWPQRLDLVGDVRGRGLMIGVEIVTDKKAKTQGGVERDRIVELAFDRGVLLLGCGPNSIRIAPPLIVSKPQADIAMDVLEECIHIAAGKPHTMSATIGKNVGP
jgi:4-aminobutyrate aminotransferase